MRLRGAVRLNERKGEGCEGMRGELGFPIYIVCIVIGPRLGCLGLENIKRGGSYKTPVSVNRSISRGGPFNNNRLH